MPGRTPSFGTTSSARRSPFGRDTPASCPGIRLAWPVGVRSLTRNGERPILLVDDDPATLAAERDALMEHGFSVITARDGAEAMRAIDAGPPPSVIVLDINMPGVDGPAFALELRQNLRHVPLVVLTGAADPRHEADRCNAEAYLSKPFDSGRLVGTVRRFAA